MSNSANSPRRRPDLGEEDHPFGGEAVLPFEKQRRVHQFLTQETRYHIIQTILGHPTHLVTLDELEYLVPKNRSTIREHLDRLADKQLVTNYMYEGNDADASDPTGFWGLTEYGVRLVDDYDYLRYVPVLRALQERLYVTEKIERHRNAPRPALPATVARAFETTDLDDETTAMDLDDETTAILEDALALREHGSGRVFDAPPIASPADADDSRPIDELF
jgi:hypothetical protein